MNVFFGALIALSYAMAPFTLIYGWIRWVKQKELGSVSSGFSFAGFVMATGSAALGITTIAYAQVHHFGFYDPILMRAMGWGFISSSTGLVLAIGGIFRRHALRWLAPLCALGMMAFWLIAAAGE